MVKRLGEHTITAHLKGGIKIKVATFLDDEKERASKIGEALNGLSISEARKLLKKVDEVLPSVAKVQCGHCDDVVVFADGPEIFQAAKPTWRR